MTKKIQSKISKNCHSYFVIQVEKLHSVLSLMMYIFKQHILNNNLKYA